MTPVLMVRSDDGLEAVDDAFAATVTAAGGSPRQAHLATD